MPNAQSPVPSSQSFPLLKLNNKQLRALFLVSPLGIIPSNVPRQQPLF
jgi:hypothetical protein